VYVLCTLMESFVHRVRAKCSTTFTSICDDADCKLHRISFGKQFNAIFTADITTFVFLLSTQTKFTESNKFSSVSRLSRDFLGGLAAIFLAA